ncbi:hypothetical protein QLX67_11885 [Balneolaceae bacterium ANBcel3]|nr:hypothetical protein [Balneolaceae bacterium ANBcel3]
MARFDTLFSISLYHPFFEDGIAKGISLVPDEKTRGVMDACGLLFRTTGKEIRVLTELDTEAIEAKKMKRFLPEGFRFTFKLMVSNPLFYTITDTKGVSLFENCWLFDNHQQSQGEESLFLHPGPTVDEATSVLLKTGNTEFTYEWDTDTEVGSAFITDTSGRCFISQTIDSSEGKTRATFDLSRLEPDIYNLQTGTTIRPIYYDRALNRADPMIGLVRIGAETVPDPAFRLLDEEQSLNQPEFKLKFDAMKTFWRYHIISRSGMETANLALESAEYPFKATSHAGHPETDLLFQSEVPIPMTEKGVKDIHLKKNNGSIARQLIESLPGPGPEISGEDPEGSETLYSDIFVYI